MKSFRRIASVLCIVLLLACVRTETAQASNEGRVLFISSYSYSWSTTQIQIEGIKQGIGSKVTVDYEFMDTKRVDDEESARLFYEGLKYRMEHLAPYDVIIVGDDAALAFAVQYQEELFDGIPILFEGINNEEWAMEVAKDPLITGVIEKLSVEKNVNLGLALNPKATKVVAILDDTLTGQTVRESFYRAAGGFPNLEFSEINSSALSYFELRQSLDQVTEDSILIYVTLTEDADGNHYSDQQTIEMLNLHAKVPVYRMVEGGIGSGLLGGNIVSMELSGKIVAELATEIINGTKQCAKIDVMVDAPNIYCIDEQVMRKFGLKMSALPKDTTIVNKQVTFWERNRQALVTGSILLVLLAGVLAWALVDNQRNRKLFAELNDARGILQNASEHDFLTGLANRSKFMHDLETTIGQEKPCTLMMIDIDNFKGINDTLGHKAGDEALQQVAERLKEMHSQILTAYRFAGDEFIIILQSCQKKLVEKSAYQCRQLFTKPFTLAGEKRKICGSIGIATYPTDTTDLEKLIEYADEAMYEVKKNGKNDFAFYHPGSGRQ